jgi:hypothetical protein
VVSGGGIGSFHQRAATKRSPVQRKERSGKNRSVSGKVTGTGILCVLALRVFFRINSTSAFSMPPKVRSILIKTKTVAKKKHLFHSLILKRLSVFKAHRTPVSGVRDFHFTPKYYKIKWLCEALGVNKASFTWHFVSEFVSASLLLSPLWFNELLNVDSHGVCDFCQG